MSAIYCSFIWFNYLKSVKKAGNAFDLVVRLFLCFYSDSDTCACKGYFCDIIMSPAFLFWTLHLSKFKYKPSVRKRVQIICLLTTFWRKVYFYCVHLVGLFWYSLGLIFLLVESSFQYFQLKSVIKNKNNYW